MSYWRTVLSSQSRSAAFRCRRSGLRCSKPSRPRHDVVSRNLMDLDYQLVGNRFDAAFRATPIGDLHLCRIEASPHQAERSNGGISRSTSADLVFNFVLSGSLTAEQDDRVAHLGVGD